MTRRELLIAATVASLSSAASLPKAPLAVEGYIFQQYAQTRKNPLADVIGQVLPMAKAAGFRNVELSPPFFAPDIRDRTLTVLRSQGLLMPSLYVGGSLHEEKSANETISTALKVGSLCVPFGCRAIVNNPDPKPGNTPKTDAELQVQADSLNRMGKTLAQHGFELRVHHHTPQLENNAKEWRYILHQTDPEYVHICVDIDWAYESGFEPIPFLKEVWKRLREIHVRSARNKLWLEDLEDSDIDYRQVAEYLTKAGLAPLIVVELAYRPNTLVTRPLQEDLRLSRLYAEQVFGVKADA